MRQHVGQRLDVQVYNIHRVLLDGIHWLFRHRCPRRGSRIYNTYHVGDSLVAAAGLDTIGAETQASTSR